MRLPVVKGMIDRRLLVNFRVDPERIRRILPPPFEPKLVDGWSIAGICLIRFKQIRPRAVPAMFGIASENAAHRIAITWEREGVRREGVYIPRRDTSSRFNAMVGGRLFPGVHHHAHFDVREHERTIHVAFESDDRSARVLVEGHIAQSLPESSVFNSVEQASSFFEGGSVGYSPAAEGTSLDGLKLRTAHWHVEPFAITRVESSFFANPDVFPPGSAIFDCALLMRHVAHEWHEQPEMSAGAEVVNV